jgi:hypothetical protein
MKCFFNFSEQDPLLSVVKGRLFAHPRKKTPIQKTLCDLLPVIEDVNMPSNRSYEHHRSGVSEVLFLKYFNKLLRVEPAVGDDTGYLDVVMDAIIGIGEEGEDNCSRKQHCPTVSQMDGFITAQ